MNIENLARCTELKMKIKNLQSCEKNVLTRIFLNIGDLSESRKEEMINLYRKLINEQIKEYYTIFESL